MRELARQVLFAQLLPLGLGVAARRLIPALTVRIEPALHKLGSILLALLLVLALLDGYQAVVSAGVGVGAAVVVATFLALAIGHAMVGPIRRRAPPPPSRARCAMPASRCWWPRSTGRHRLSSRACSPISRHRH